MYYQIKKRLEQFRFSCSLKTGWTGFPLYLEMHVVGLGALGTLTWSFSVIFFSGQSQSSLVSGHPALFLSPWSFLMPTGKCGPLIPPSAPLRPELGATSEMSSLSEHAFSLQQASGQAARTEQIE